MKLTQLRQLIKEEIAKVNEEESGSQMDSYLPLELKGNPVAHDIISKIIDLLDTLNDPQIDQSENGVSDQMRKMALHMIDANR